MNRRLIRIALGAAVAIACFAAFAPLAAAESVVLGSPLNSPYEDGVSGGANTVSVQLSFDPATSTNPVISPANGVITGWKVKSADDGAVYTLKVLRPNGAVSLATMTNSNFSAISSVQAPTAVPAGTMVATPTGVVFDYPGASLPISKGDYVGILTGGDDDGLPQAMANGLPQSLIANNFTAQPADGSSADLLADAQHELLLQATIQFCRIPNVLGQAEAAASAAITAAECTSTVTKQQLRLRAIKKSFSKKKKKRIRAANAALRAQDGKVLRQGTPADTTAIPGTAVALTVGQVVPPPKQKKKKK